MTVAHQAPPPHQPPVAATAAPALLTDFYQLTMAHAYFERDMQADASFELFSRRLPRTRNFLVAAGLAQVVDYLRSWRFEPAELEWLAAQGSFPPAFIDYLAGLRFTGSLDAMPEGTVFFGNEPVLRVTAPMPVAQLVESRILNLIHFQSVVASKAARCVLAAGGRRLIDFGMRRAHGAEAALLAARAAWLAGFDATATVEAGRQFGIPVSGTMAHSFIQAHAHEIDAFRDYLAVRPGSTTLLIDTFDTRAGARIVVELLRELRRSGAERRVAAVRIDSGDLAADATAVRAIFDEAGFPDVGIVLSGGLDEYAVAELIARNTPVNAFGIGTRLDVAEDAPSLDMAYKLQVYAGQATRKRSVGKATLPGCKQVHRRLDREGRFAHDSLHLESEPGDGEPLLVPTMRAGTLTGPLPTLAEARERAQRQLAGLPDALRALTPAPPYPVAVSTGIQELIGTLDAGR